MPEQKASRLQYKTWSGIRIRGVHAVPVPVTGLHIDHAAFLATSLESPKMGAVQSYDRCAMSGGPFHFTAIQPKAMVQGALFQLLRHIEATAGPCPPLNELWRQLSMKNWYVAHDGKLRDITSGKVISAHAIRNEFTPPGGKVPKAGARRTQAVKWARAFHNLLVTPKTFTAQQDFAIQYLMRGQRKLESSFYEPYELVSLRCHGNLGATSIPSIASIAPDTDLALCMYHSHSVNAPGPARKCLIATDKKFPGDKRFSPEAAKYLIRRMGKYKYGRWQDTKDGRNRYDHTRHAAMKSELWPKSLFTGASAIMPKDLA